MEWSNMHFVMSLLVSIRRWEMTKKASDYAYNDNLQQCETVGRGETVEKWPWNGVELTGYHMFVNLVDP